MTAPADASTASGTAVTVSATATDNVGVVGVQFLLDGVALGAEDTTSPYSITWNSTGASNGSHTLSARARDAAGNTTTSAVVTVTVSNALPTSPVMDQTVFKDQPLARATVATAAFSTTSANELLLAFIATDAVPTSANVTVTGVTGAGLTWVLVARENAQMGTSEIWRAFAPTTLTSVTVTATLSKAVSSQITVVTFSNVDTTGINGAGAIGATATQSKPAGAPIATLVTTRNNSWVFGVGNDFDNPIARTVGANQTMVHQYLPPVGDTYWVQRTTNPIPAAGTSVDIFDTAPTGDRFNLAICEIRAPQ
jgi:hypothetical protein